MTEFNEIRRSHLIRQAVIAMICFLGAANVALAVETLSKL